MINPSFVTGPSFITTSNSGSIQFMKNMLNGKYYMGAPELIFGFVDVRDVAKTHILAFESDAIKGRHILVERTMSIYELSKIIKKKYGKKYKLPLIKVPKFILYLTGWMFG